MHNNNHYEKKKNMNQKTNPETVLVKSKSQFRSEILKRIEIGNDLLESPINENRNFGLLRDEFNSWNGYNLELLKQSFSIEHNSYRKEYADAGQWSGVRMRAVGVPSDPNEPVRKLVAMIKAKLKSLKNLEQKIEILKSSDADDRTSSELDKSKIFIVHGHDDATKNEVARFVEKLGFEAIILHEKASSGKTIIEKIEHYSNVGFGIVLYTACDVGAKVNNDGKLNQRARQNVVFEHGYLIGKIGRENVCALVKGNIEKPNDISGVVYVSLNEDWKTQLGKELVQSGYNFEASRIFS
jgi:predicted nucleotide-binding protein